jgi:hypothetical protein
MTIERRFITAQELRVADGDAGPTIRGYAAMFNTRSEVLSEPRLGRGFREIIKPGAFADALGQSDIRALWNHDPNFVLGRVKSGTLTVREDKRGLAIDNIPPDTQWARDLLVSIRRGDVDGMSFGFTVRKGGDAWSRDEDGMPLRTINAFQEINDVSPVTYPAYPDTAIAVRSLDAWLSEHGEEVDEDWRAELETLRRFHRQRMAR